MKEGTIPIRGTKGLSTRPRCITLITHSFIHTTPQKTTVFISIFYYNTKSRICEVKYRWRSHNWADIRRLILWLRSPFWRQLHKSILRAAEYNSAYTMPHITVHTRCHIKLNFALEQATKAQIGSRGVALLFL
jgi:hypothetical protein